jgi:uncharacterized protein YndB with AHSA1/START domain
MRILKRVVLALVALVALLVLVAYMFPRHVELDRSVVIAAPAEAIYPLIVEPRRFQEWSPWYEKDPNAKYTYEGPERGVGASMRWSGNRDVGEGSQTVIAAEENRRVETALDFGPQGTATASFTLTPQDRGTRVVWGFVTDLGFNPMSRWFGLFFESLLGPDYEQGLANLKRVVEAGE